MIADIKSSRNSLPLHPTGWALVILGCYATLGAAVSLLGWVIDKQPLADWFQSGVSIQPNSAAAIVLSGCGLLLLATGFNRAVLVPGAIVLLIGLVTLVQYAFQVNVGIDTLLLFDRPWGRSGTTNPGRMGIPACISLTLVGTALICASRPGHIRRAIPIIGLAVAIISTLSITGFLFGVDTLYKLPALTAISLQTATFLLAISLGLVVSVPEQEPMRTILMPTGAGLLARWTLPFIIVVPLLLGFVRQQGELAGMYDTQFGSALRTIIEIALFTILMWWAVRIIGKREAEIQSAVESLARSERELSDFFESAAIGLHWVGPDGTILRVNQAELDSLGYERDEYVGRHIAEFHISQPVIEDILERLTRGERLTEYPAQMRRKDGGIVDVIINSSVLFENGEFIHTRCFTRDVTQQKRAEQALREADRRKDEFLATLAHELRNPLAPISNSLQLMKHAKGDTKLADEARDIAERQVEHMVRLIDDLLDLSRVTRNKLELRRTHIDLADTVKSAAEICRDMIENGGHILSISAPAEAIFVDADPVRITQIVTNLLSNACKFMERGGRIKVTIDQYDGQAIVTVKDTGIGIPNEMLDKVFDMFTQVDRSLERTQAGLGIGLSLTKRLVELHGGSIVATSGGPGTGSEFVVKLPVAIGETVAEPPTPVTVHSPRSKSRRILVVDDNADSAESLAMLLKIHGNDTRVASDGIEAIEKGAAFRPDVILLDIGMPGMNGYDACQTLRAKPWGKELLLIAMTGWGQEADRRRSAEAGFDHHLVKPIDHTQLLQLLGTKSVRPMSSPSTASDFSVTK